MTGGWGFAVVVAVCFAAALGLPLVAVGAILRLCESGWGKRRGALGSTPVLAGGLLLCLPLACYFALGWARAQVK
jgi:hypothetical protein